MNKTDALSEDFQTVLEFCNGNPNSMLAVERIKSAYETALSRIPRDEQQEVAQVISLGSWHDTALIAWRDGPLEKGANLYAHPFIPAMPK